MFQSQRIIEDLKNNIFRMDKMILSIVYALVTISTIFVYSATRQNGMVVKNILWIVIGTILMFIIASFDYKHIKLYIWHIYGIGAVLLLLVRFAGKKTLGAQRWIALGPFQLQPSEFVKVIIILIIATFLALFPFYFMFVSGTNTNADILAVPPRLVPGFELIRNFQLLSKKIGLLRSTWNTLTISVIYTVVCTVLFSAAGYALALFSFKGRNVIFGFILASMMIPALVMYVPLFEMMIKINLTDTYAGVVLPLLANACLSLPFRHPPRCTQSPLAGVQHPNKGAPVHVEKIPAPRLRQQGSSLFKSSNSDDAANFSSARHPRNHNRNRGKQHGKHHGHTCQQRIHPARLAGEYRIAAAVETAHAGRLCFLSKHGRNENNRDNRVKHH